MSNTSRLTETKIDWYRKYRKYIQRIQRRHKLKLEFLINHADNIIKHTLRLSRRHAVIKKNVRIKKHSISVKYDLPISRMLKKQKKKISWLKYYKEHAKTRQSPVVTVEEIPINCEPSTSKPEQKGDTSCDEDVSQDGTAANLSTEDVTNKLKEQLNILKSGKRDVSLLGDVDKPKPPKASISIKDTSTVVEKNKEKAESVQKETLRTARSLSDSNSTVENTLNDSDLSEKSTSFDRTKFLDSLISKLGSSAEKNETNATSSKATFTSSKSSNKNGILIKKTIQPSGKQLTPKNGDEKSVSQEVDSESRLKNVSDTDSSCSSDFRGFTEKEVYEAKLQLLASPTRELENSDISAFVSENLDNFFRENCLEDSSTVEISKPSHYDDGLVVDALRPPHMPEPAVQSSIKARTVAEKRQLLAKCGNMEWMVEIENTVFREIQKRQKSKNYVVTNVIKELQDAKIPFHRECWRATSWLCTEIGKYYFQTISIDGCELRLFGSRGNHDFKLLASQSSRPFERHTNEICPAVCREKGPINNIRLFMPFDKDIGGCKSPKVKAAPLSKKCLQMIPHTSNLNLGPLIKYNMPQIELEVFPRLNKPLNDHVKPYLKMLTVSGDITKEFAQYAASVVVNKSNTKKSNHPISFKFKIPYENDQKYLLVRKIYERREDHSQLEKELSFAKLVDEKDDVAFDCANALTDMINSAAIGLCEESFTKRDPDIDYEKINNETDFKAIDPKSIKPNIDRKSSAGKLRTELKRLNATFVDAQRTVLEGKSDCTESQCKLGCICHSIAVPAIARKHCRKAACMFDCTCEDKIRYLDASDEILTDNNVLLLREKVTAKLARVEKEFCSTVVLTDDQPLLVNDPHISRKRTKKVPKRFQDYVNEDLKNAEARQEAKTEVEPVNESVVKYKFDTTAQINVPKTYPIMKDSASDQFRHCLVKIRRLKGLESVEPWCMLHCVYKCFCHSRATKGQALTTGRSNVNEDHALYSRKRKYSFDKPESASKGKEKEVPSLSPRKQAKVQKGEIPSQTQTLVNKYTPENYCSRSRPIPREFYRQRNLLRLQLVLQRIDIEETTNVAKKLAQIMKNSAENKKKLKQMKDDEKNTNLNHRSNSLSDIKLPVKRKSQTLEKSSSEVPSKRLANGPSSQNQDESVPVEIILKPSSSRSENPSVLADLPPMKVHKIHLPEIQRSPIERRQTEVVKPITRVAKNILEVTPTITEGSPDMLNIDVQKKSPKLPVISSVRSLNSSGHEKESPKTNHNPKTGANPPVNHLNGFINIENLVTKVQSKELLELSVKKLNCLVTRAMHCFCDNQRQSSPNLPVPTKGIVFLHKWSDFIQAYNEQKLHVWYVSTNNEKILVATKENLMPRVIGAISNSNIKAVSDENLPLLAKLVKSGFVYGKPNQLSVFMYGEQDYWKICGFTHSKNDYLTQGCVVKPTPQSHPSLSCKINKLFKVIFCTEWNTLNVSSSGKKMPNITVTKTANKLEGGPKPASRRGNVEELPISERESKNIYIPMTTQGVSYWLMFKIGNDFSQLFIPAWETLVDFNQIRYALRLSATNDKVVQIIRGKGKTGIYATPPNNDAIYIGPFERKYAIELILLQKFNGRILRREDFENLSKTKARHRSVMFWLQLSGDKLIRHSDCPQKDQRIACEQTGSDCIVIEDDEESDTEILGVIGEPLESSNMSIFNLPGTSSLEEVDLSKKPNDNDLPHDNEIQQRMESTTNSITDGCDKQAGVSQPKTAGLNDERREETEKIGHTGEQDENSVDRDQCANETLTKTTISREVKPVEALMSQNIGSEIDNGSTENIKPVTRCISENRLEIDNPDESILPLLDCEPTEQPKNKAAENMDNKLLESKLNLNTTTSSSKERSLLRKKSSDSVRSPKYGEKEEELTVVLNSNETRVLNLPADIAKQMNELSTSSDPTKLSKETLNPTNSQKTPISTNKVAISLDKSNINHKKAVPIQPSTQTSQIKILEDISIIQSESLLHITQNTVTKSKSNINLSSGAQNSEIENVRHKIPNESNFTNNESNFKSPNFEQNIEQRPKATILPTKTLETKKLKNTPPSVPKSSKLMEHVQNLSKKMQRRLSTSVSSSNREDDKIKFETSTGYIIVERLKKPQSCVKSVSVEQSSKGKSYGEHVSKNAMNVLAQLPKNLPKDLIITPEEPLNRSQELHTWKKVKRLSGISKPTPVNGYDMEKGVSTEPIVDLTENTDASRKYQSETVVSNNPSNWVESRAANKSYVSELGRLETSPSDSQAVPKPTGFLISPVLLLGKVPARRHADGYTAHLPGCKGYIKFQDVKHFGRYMVKYLLRHIKGFAPENWYPTWNYVPINSAILNKYLLHDPRKLHSKMIITSARKDTPEPKRLYSSPKVTATVTKVSPTTSSHAKLPTLPKPQIQKVIDTNPRPQAATLKRRNTICTTKPVVDPNVILIDDE